MQRLRLDKISSVTRRANLGHDVLISREMISKEGYIIAGRILNHKSVYDTVETVHGRLSKLKQGDILVGALGPRWALHGYSGRVPESLEVGQIIHVLNRGGVVGNCVSANVKVVGNPFELEVLGAVLALPHLGHRKGHPACVQEFSLPLKDELKPGPPVIMVSGTCMNSGKTAACCEIIRFLHSRGMRIGAAKLTGVSLRNDTLNMIDNGATVALDFTDVGVVTTTERTSVQIARTLANELSREKVDILVFELGDGLVGKYGVSAILSDPVWRDRVYAHVLCANDPVGAWGGKQLFEERGFGTISVISGPVTDNDVGIEFIEENLKLPAINAIQQREKLHIFLEELLTQRGLQLK